MPIPKALPKGKDATGLASDTQQKTSKPPSAKTIGGRYSVLNQLGSGNFGTVYLIADLKTNEKKVVKKIKVGDVQPDETIEAVKEASLLSQLDHPAIVKFHDSFVEEDHFCIITEYCEGGDLSNMIKQVKDAGKILEESLILDWFVQLTNAVRYIHDRRVLHRDLKTRNIFLKEDKIKLGDFGISRILVGTSDYATTFTGTPYYMSPEVLKHEGYNAKSDIWSLGVVLYELCALEHAYKGQNMMAVMYKIVEGIPPRLPDHFSLALKELFARMLDKDPRGRPSAVQILQGPFVKHHMEKLSHKLTMTLSGKKDPITPLQAKGGELRSPLKKAIHKREEPERPLTPREEMQRRKSKKADMEAERIRMAAIKNFSDNQRRYNSVKKKKNKIIPPWVGEHPDIFDDPNFSISALNLTQSHNDPSNESLMDLSLGGVASALTTPTEYDNVGGAGGSDVRGREVDPQLQLEDDPSIEEELYEYDDFDMEISSNSNESDDGDYQAIIECIEEALGLPGEQSDDRSMLEGQGSISLEPEPRPPSPLVPASHDEISPFTPQARDKRIALLKEEGRRVLGSEAFQKVYEYLKMVRGSGQEVNEGVVMRELRRLTPNTRECFIIDQLVFLEKQQNDIF